MGTKQLKVKYCRRHPKIKLISESVGGFCEDCGTLCYFCGKLKWFCPRCREIADKAEDTKYYKKVARERKHFMSAWKRGKVKVKITKDGIKAMIPNP